MKKNDENANNNECWRAGNTWRQRGRFVAQCQNYVSDSEREECLAAVATVGGEAETRWPSVSFEEYGQALTGREETQF